ncbi:MAG: TM1266 family iron-only hydrogenase system putative regulator [Christensenellales bacterium]
MAKQERPQRVGVVAVIVEKREETAAKVNEILSLYAHIIVGRMGLPYKERGVSIISLIIDGTTDDIGAMCGKLGAIDGVTAKSVLKPEK